MVIILDIVDPLPIFRLHQMYQQAQAPLSSGLPQHLAYPMLVLQYGKYQQIMIIQILDHILALRQE